MALLFFQLKKLMHSYAILESYIQVRNNNIDGMLGIGHFWYLSLQSLLSWIRCIAINLKLLYTTLAKSNSFIKFLFQACDASLGETRCPLYDTKDPSYSGNQITIENIFKRFDLTNLFFQILRSIAVKVIAQTC